MSNNRHEKYILARSVNEAFDNASEPGHTSPENARKWATDSVYRVTVELIEEQPQWWFWRNQGGWDLRPADKCGGFGMVSEPSGKWVWVYGTTADRDTKRDGLLDAARKAGKP